MGLRLVMGVYNLSSALVNDVQATLFDILYLDLFLGCALEHDARGRDQGRSVYQLFSFTFA